MAGAVRRSFWLVSLSLSMMAVVPAYGVTWPQPTPAELRMTPDAKAPGADAVYVYREEVVNDQIQIPRATAEIRILTAK